MNQVKKRLYFLYVFYPEYLYAQIFNWAWIAGWGLASLIGLVAFYG